MKNSFNDALKKEKPLQIAGTVNAYSALLAQRAGFKAIYLSGAGVANASYGLPDLGITNLNDVLIDIGRITNACDLPLLVDADTGWGNVFNIARTVREFYKAGAAGLHLEDQVAAKRCGHRPGKELVSKEEMCDRIKSAVDARTDESFIIMARTDALANEGLESALERAFAYVEAGADMIFAEAVTNISDYKEFSLKCSVPILANMTEFGKTPICSAEKLAKNGVSMVLYPLSAFRAMSKSAELVYKIIKEQKSQENVINIMQTREELYQVLKYLDFEKKIDQLFK